MKQGCQPPIIVLCMGPDRQTADLEAVVPEKIELIELNVKFLRQQRTPASPGSPDFFAQKATCSRLKADKQKNEYYK